MGLIDLTVICLSFLCIDDDVEGPSVRWSVAPAASTLSPSRCTTARPLNRAMQSATAKSSPSAALTERSTAISARCRAKTAGKIKLNLIIRLLRLPAIYPWSNALVVCRSFVHCFVLAQLQEIRVRSADGALPRPGRFPFHWMQPHLPVRVRPGVRNRPQDLFQRMLPSAGELPLPLISQQEVPRQMRWTRTRT